MLGEPFASSRAAHLEQAPRSAQDCAASASAPSPLGSAAMSVSSEDAARGVVGRPHAGNTASALAGMEKVRSSDGTQRAGALREMRPRAWLAVTGATRPDEADRAWSLNRGVGLRRTCRVRIPRSMPARARLRKDEPSRFIIFREVTRIRDALFRSSGAGCRAWALTSVQPRARGSA